MTKLKNRLSWGENQGLRYVDVSYVQGIAPPTLNLEHPDTIFDGLFSPLSTPKRMDIRAVLTNSFGFGGTNAALVFAAPPESS